MTSINEIRLVGKLVKDPEFFETGKRRAARLKLETEDFFVANGERKRFAETHTVVCYNQFSLPVIEKFARSGVRLKVSGKLAYDREGKAEIRVMQYSGECALMDPVQSEGEAAPAAPRTAATPSGGLGRLPKGDGAHPVPPREPPPRSMSDDDETDSIPF